jgi:HEAT repeat protein
MSHYSFSELLDRIRNEDTRWDAILALKLNTDPAWVEPLIASLQDPDWVIRWCCAEKLGDFKSEAAIKPLISLLADPDGHVRKNAMNTLCRYEPSVLSHLIPFLGTPNYHIRRNTSMIIRKFGPQAIPVLEASVEKRSKLAANILVHAIWTLGGPDSEHALIRLLHYTHLQKNIIILLGNLKSRMSIPYLVQLFKKPPLKRPILHTLTCIGPDSAYPEVINLMFSQKQNIASGAYETVIRLGKSALPYLLSALNDPDANVETLVKVLDRIGPHSVLDDLERIAQTSERSHESLFALVQKYRS